MNRVHAALMLHHIPSAELQDRALAEAARVLRPGGTLAGTDSVGKGWLFRTIHIGDTLNLLDPAALAARLTEAGFVRAAGGAGRPLGALPGAQAGASGLTQRVSGAGFG